MSEYSTPEERTEMPTSKRMSMLRREGALFISHEVVNVVSLVVGFLMVCSTWSWLLASMKAVMIKSYQLIARSEPLSVKDLENGFLGLLIGLGPQIMFIVVVTAIVASLAVFLQSDWNFRERKMNFNFALLNPASGIKRIFSMLNIVGVLKSLAKLGVILPIAYFAIKGFAPKMIMLMHLSVPEILVFSGVAIHTVFWKIVYFMIGIAIFDFVWGKYQWLRQNKMTKSEVKDEKKAVEGDEETKRKIIAKGMQRMLIRIKTAVPRADVVVTNPTHYAVALKYDRQTMTAPVVVAKGKGFLALRIREIAKESRVPVLERKALARALYASAEVGSEIPYDLFKAVAEVLAYVYKLKNPYKYFNQASS